MQFVCLGAFPARARTRGFRCSGHRLNRRWRQMISSVHSHDDSEEEVQKPCGSVKPTFVWIHASVYSQQETSAAAGRLHSPVNPMSIDRRTGWFQQKVCFEGSKEVYWPVKPAMKKVSVGESPTASLTKEGLHSPVDSTQRKGGHRFNRR